ncbi:unnamed protein product [Sphagnum balticum]
MPLAASAQRQTDPNIGHFYMARQQVSITDDSPVINNRVNGGPGAAQMPGNGALPAGPPATCSCAVAIVCAASDSTQPEHVSTSMEAPAATSIGNGANGKVYGDVLHWARQHH